MKILNFTPIENQTKDKPDNSEKNLSAERKQEIVRKQYYKEYVETQDPLKLASAVMHDDNGNIILYNRHHQIHKEIYQFIKNKENKNYNLLIQIFVGGGKTSHICAMLAGELIKNPHKRCLILTATNKLASQRKTIIQQYIENILKIKNIFIPYKNQNANRNFLKTTSTQIRMKGAIHKEDSVECASLESASIGNRADWIILDDVEHAQNKNEIEKIKEIYNRSVRDRKSGESRVIVINTPYYNNGIIKYFEKSPTFKTLKLGLSPTLVNWEQLENIKNEIEKNYHLETVLKTRIIDLLNKKNIFDALDLVKNNITDLHQKIKETVDFKIYKEIIQDNETIETDILPEWDYLVKKKGREILDKFINETNSYMLTHALKPEETIADNFFTKHHNADISLLEYQSYKEFRSEKVHFFSYDIANEGISGLVITEFKIICHTGRTLIKSQRTTKGGAIEIEKNILENPRALHVIENNGQQKNIVQLIQYHIPDHIKPHIIEHTTTKNKNDAIRGIMSMDRAFENKDMVFLAEGHGIQELKECLTDFDNKFDRHHKHDKIMSLWIGYYNIINTAAQYVKIKTMNQSDTNEFYRRDLKHV